MPFVAYSRLGVVPTVRSEPVVGLTVLLLRCPLNGWFAFSQRAKTMPSLSTPHIEVKQHSAIDLPVDFHQAEAVTFNTPSPRLPNCCLFVIVLEAGAWHLLLLARANQSIGRSGGSTKPEYGQTKVIVLGSPHPPVAGGHGCTVGAILLFVA